MPISRLTSRCVAVSTVFCTLTLSSCNVSQRHWATQVALFPVNLVPDILSNTLVLLAIPLWAPSSDRESNLWPLAWVSAPIVGPVSGVLDAWYGYPFWQPHALEEHREFGRSERESQKASPEDQASSEGR